MQTRTHTYTHTQMPEHTQTHSETEPAKYQCTSAGHRRAAESTRERTHSHQTRCKRTHTRSHTLSHSHSCTLVQRFFGGHCLKARGDERAENENRGEGRGKEGKGEKIEEMEKSSTELFSLFRKICHPCAPWFPSKGHSTFDEWRTDTFDVQLFQEGTPLRPGSVWSSTGMDILQKKTENKVLFLSVFRGNGSRIRVRSLLGRCGFCRNGDGCGRGRVVSGKETESIMKKLGSEWRKRQTKCEERVCEKGNAEATLQEKCPPKNLSVVLHVTEEMETTETPISPRSPAFLLFALTLSLSLPTYTCIH